MRRLPRLIRPTNDVICFGGRTPLTPAITGLVPRKNQSYHTDDNAQQTLVTIPTVPSVFFAANCRFFAQERSLSQRKMQMTQQLEIDRQMICRFVEIAAGFHPCLN